MARGGVRDASRRTPRVAAHRPTRRGTMSAPRLHWCAHDAIARAPKKWGPRKFATSDEPKLCVARFRFARRSRQGVKVRGFGKPENAKRAAQRGAVSIRCSTLCLAAETRLNGSVLLHCAHNENPTSTLVASRYYASIIGIRDDARRFAVPCFYYWYSRRSSSLRGTMLLLFATTLVASRYHASIIRDDARRFD